MKVSINLLIMLYVTKSCFFVAELKEQTKSLWSFTNSRLDYYKNPLYWANIHQAQILLPVASIRHMQLWKSYYCRWNPSMRTQVTILKTVCFLLLIHF